MKFLFEQITTRSVNLQIHSVLAFCDMLRHVSRGGQSLASSNIPAPSSVVFVNIVLTPAATTWEWRSLPFTCVLTTRNSNTWPGRPQATSHFPDVSCGARTQKYWTRKRRTGLINICRHRAINTRDVSETLCTRPDVCGRLAIVIHWLTSFFFELCSDLISLYVCLTWTSSSVWNQVKIMTDHTL